MAKHDRDIREDVLELFAEASHAPRSIFADMPYGSVGIEFSRGKRRHKEDPLFRRLRRKKHYKQNRLRLLGVKRDERLRKPEIIAQQKARLAALQAATCTVCDRRIHRANKSGPVAKVCSRRCDNVLRARRKTAERQAQRAIAVQARTCARCGDPIGRKPHVRGQLPKYCSRRCINAGKWARYSARKREQTGGT
jgi:endogenous inhibitor of DNA gyrase (YacG/DUF329 family)